MHASDQLTRKLYGGADPVEALMFLTAKYTLLPDLFDVFGREYLLAFLEIFGGKTIRVPPLEEVEKALTALAIWSSMKNANDPNTVKRLASKYNITQTEVRAAYRRVQDMFNEQSRRFEQAAEKAAKGATPRGVVRDVGRKKRKGGRKPDLSKLYGADAA